MSTRTRKYKDSELILVEVPKRTPKRYKWLEDRKLMIDMRCVRKPGKRNPSSESRRRFKSPEHLEALCKEYFSSCDGVLYNHKTGLPYLDKDGVPLVGQIKPYTVSGLALYLDMTTESLKKYEKGLKDDIGIEEENILQYSKVLRRARQHIESYAEGMLYDRNGSNGAKFVLDCAFNWIGARDSAEIESRRKMDNLKEKEYELKKKVIDGEENEDTGINITITRAKRNDED